MSVENFTVEQIKEIERADTVELARILMRIILDRSSKGKRPSDSIC